MAIRRATPSWDRGPWGISGPASGSCATCGKEIFLSPTRDDHGRFVHSDTYKVRCEKETAR
jgi:hypothetical protein